MMTSLQRVLTTLGHQEPDRVPLFLLVTLHGARELGISIREYYSRPEHVVEGQLRMRSKYRHDCVYGFFHASLEMEAFGGETIFIEDGPPNAGQPVIRKPEDILALEVPRIHENACLQKVLEAQRSLKARIQDEAPIIGVVMSPFSLPVMQMGFESYLNLIYERRDLFDHLMKINEEFCVNWANAQLASGATAICFFDPVSSTSIVTREQYLQTGFPSARRTLARIQGPTATHFASGRCLPIVDDVAQTGTAIIGVSIDEDLLFLKRAAGKKLSLLGNLNGLEMRRWTAQQAEDEVKKAISRGGKGGGFILSDNHGEIPFQVPERVLLALSDAARAWGEYPLHWVDQ
jgi:uroporphyrinogen decarboxylase